MFKNSLVAARRRLRWLNLPGAMLLVLLQRTPVLRQLVVAENSALTAPVGAVLKSTIAGLAALGGLHSRAGATELVSNVSGPLNATVGTAIPTVAFGLAGTQTNPSSWVVGGTLAPGLRINGSTSTGNFSGQVLSLTGTPTAAGTYSLSISGSDAGFTSPDFEYTVIVTGGVTATIPAISTQPTAQTVTAGASVTFSVVAAGTPTPTYQWRKDGTAISGATSASLSLSNVQTANAGSYTVVVTNSAGSVTSTGATLTVNAVVVGTPPAISVQPSSTTAAPGSTVSFNVSATGAVTQQWRKNGTAIPGATSTTLTLVNLGGGDVANYDVVLSNASGTTTSAAATLLLNAGLTARLSNVSVLTTLAANQVLTVGLTMQGGAKPVLLRAAGPGLGALGVPGTMTDPRLALFNGSAQVAANDNWGTPAADVGAVSAAISSLGAFPFVSTASLDAAMVTTFEGGRTAQVSGPTAGSMIIEAYDAGAGNTTRLTNLSALNFVGPGSPLIAGFTIAGTGTKNLLIRAVGPSLGALGVPGTLADPKLVLQTSGQVLVADNDTFSASLPAVFATVGAFPFVVGGKDAAIIVSLPAGGYTVTVSGADGGSGTAIIEVYELP